jgi:hypothetical protein
VKALLWLVLLGTCAYAWHLGLTGPGVEVDLMAGGEGALLRWLYLSGGGQ